MIGNRVRNERKLKGYSITELARQAGVSKSYLSYIERNLQQNPSLQILSKIAAALDTSIDYLLEERIEEQPAEPAIILDKEWEGLFRKAVNEGMSKEDFRDLLEYVKFKNWLDEKENISSGGEK
ncbi:helix-turn-helix domain-containing protein [Sediminibacillus albus]|uniref:Transcriptional regulator, contains XRE-family HTH domain n=1 Tax=Sediminibacillus albus TaxID=407036 RepID=A0A1G9B812_9BACI|nr:helix-turn-helix domain-containing protein [Sediminibacillus albus]SDK35619.1 Transcriptional regulator, contains XRE-family HTH domain [Sediminibacillus albus]